MQKPSQVGQTPEERALLGRILGLGLVDLLRRFHCDDDRLFTWWPPWRNLRERNHGWRLDYVLASDALAPTALSCDVHREFGTSDHGPVAALLSLELSRYEGEPSAATMASRAGAPQQLSLTLGRSAAESERR